jgi:hypothetical protein
MARSSAAAIRRFTDGSFPALCLDGRRHGWSMALRKQAPAGACGPDLRIGGMGGAADRTLHVQ